MLQRDLRPGLLCGDLAGRRFDVAQPLGSQRRTFLRRPQGLLGLCFLGPGPCGQGECVREPGDGVLTLEQRPKLRGPRGLFLGRQLGLALEWFEGLVDIGPERLLTPRQALGRWPWGRWGRPQGRGPRRLGSTSAPSSRCRASSRSPRSSGATASWTTFVLRRPRPFSTSGASTSSRQAACVLFEGACAASASFASVPPLVRRVSPERRASSPWCSAKRSVRLPREAASAFVGLTGQGRRRGARATS